MRYFSQINNSHVFHKGAAQRKHNRRQTNPKQISTVWTNKFIYRSTERIVRSSITVYIVIRGWSTQSNLTTWKLWCQFSLKSDGKFLLGNWSNFIGIWDVFPPNWDMRDKPIILELRRESFCPKGRVTPVEFYSVIVFLYLSGCPCICASAGDVTYSDWSQFFSVSSATAVHTSCQLLHLSCPIHFVLS